MTVLNPLIDLLVGWKRRAISFEQVHEETGLPRRPLLRVLDNLAGDGYLTEISDEPVRPGPGECGPPRRNPTWKINKDKSLLERAKPKPRKNTVRDKVWKLIRAKRRFLRGDIETLLTASRSSIDKYVLALEREGYLRRIGKDGKEVLWMLVKDTGPKRPRISDKGVGI
ncbi:hypothetical protein ACFL6N_07955 [Thermodesulfobacteriota bacterium]